MDQQEHMHSLRMLYQDMLLDHGRSPRRFRKNPAANWIKEGHNPVCGDQLTLYITEKAGCIEDVCFQGEGCAISVASASLMAEMIQGKTVQAAQSLFTAFHHALTAPASAVTQAQCDALGKLVVLRGVRAYPSRVKCATLSWQTLHSLLRGEQGAVSTEAAHKP